jgi:hypothetical protein
MAPGGDLHELMAREVGIRDIQRALVLVGDGTAVDFTANTGYLPVEAKFPSEPFL